MPSSQSIEFNRYIGLMNVANRELSLVIGFLERMTRELELREAWLVSLILWQEHVDEIGRAIRLVARMPITESDYAARVEQARQEWVSIRELASFLAGEYDAWQESDWEESDEGERDITDEAWQRVVAEKDRALRALVANGSLPAQGKGSRLKVRMGAFDDLRDGKPAPCRRTTSVSG